MGVCVWGVQEGGVHLGGGRCLGVHVGGGTCRCGECSQQSATYPLISSNR